MDASGCVCRQHRRPGATMSPPELDVSRTGDGSLVLGLSGSWRLAAGIPSVGRVREALAAQRTSRVRFDTSELAAWDSGLLTSGEVSARRGSTHGRLCARRVTSCRDRTCELPPVRLASASNAVAHGTERTCVGLGRASAASTSPPTLRRQSDAAFYSRTIFCQERSDECAFAPGDPPESCQAKEADA